MRPVSRNRVKKLEIGALRRWFQPVSLAIHNARSRAFLGEMAERLKALPC